MNYLVPIGLLLDIVGAVMIFCCASQTKTEHALSYGLMKDIEAKYESGEYTEWSGGPYGTGTFAEYKKHVTRAGRRMFLNQRLARVGLALLIVGFSLQLLGYFC